jgi:hypothetical protein
VQATKKARIGITLIAVGIALAFLWWYSVGYVFLVWYQSYQISALMFAALAVAPSVILTAVGLVSYIMGRTEFWKTRSKRKRLLAFLGLILMFFGGFFVAYAWSLSSYAAGRSLQQSARPLTYYLANNSPYFILFVLWFMTPKPKRFLELFYILQFQSSRWD